MTVQTVLNVTPIVEWDDSAVFVFSFTDNNGNKQFAGFPHIPVAVAIAQGSQTQVTALTQAVSQQQLQISVDPQTWIETVKNAARNASANMKITITFDDAQNIAYTTLTGLQFQLQMLHSLAG
jgi:hypothetical protein